MNDNEKTTNEQTPAPEVVPMPAAAPVAAPAHQTNGLAIASLVLGILAFLSGWFFLGILLGIAAIVLGIMGMKKPGGKGMSIAGIITGSLGALSGLAFTAFWVIALVSGAALVGTSNSLVDSIDKELASSQSELDAKKDFARGETGVFGDFDVKVTSVTRNYVPDNEYSQASEGKELVVVKVSATNARSDSPESIGSYDFKVNVGGVATTASYVDVEPTFEGGSVSKGATVEGNIVFEVTEGTDDLKLQYESYAIDFKNAEGRTLVYTLEF